MTGRDLLFAIADAEEQYALESEQFPFVAAAIRAERKKMLLRFAAIGIAAVICIAVFGIVRFMPGSFRVATPPDVTGTLPSVSAPLSEPSTGLDAAMPGITEETVAPAVSGVPAADPETQTQLPGSVAAEERTSVSPGSTVRPETGEEPSHSSAKATAAPTSPAPESTFAAPSVEPSSVSATVYEPAEREPVYQELTVDYETAKTTFTHPIAPCERDDFSGYRVIMVGSSDDGNGRGMVCRTVVYVFSNGSVWLTDQNRLADPITPVGSRYDEQGKTFYVHTPEFNGDRLRVWFFPTGESGLAYQADFGGKTDMAAVIDLLLSLEI